MFLSLPECWDMPVYKRLFDLVVLHFCTKEKHFCHFKLIFYFYKEPDFLNNFYKYLLYITIKITLLLHHILVCNLIVLVMYADFRRVYGQSRDARF